MSEVIDPWAGDCLERKKFGDLLLACLQAEAVFCDEAFVVALTGRFGSGKSHFFDMWVKDLLLKSADDPAKSPMVVTVNAWESDFSGEPLLALVSAISNQVSATKDAKAEASVRDLKRGLAGAVGVAKWALSGLIEDKTGVAPEEVIAAFEDGSVGDELDRCANALLSEFKARKRALEKLRTSLRSLIESRSPAKEGELKLVIVVDELDRCHPRYAIEFLEAIKHVFNVRGLAVVLGVDWEQLCCTATACFGQELNTEEYLRKFIKRRVRLPDADDMGMKRVSEKLFATYLRDKSDENSAWELMVRSEGEPGALLGAYLQAIQATPRQADSIVHLLSFYYRATDRANWRCYPVDLFIATLAVAGRTLFDELLRCESDPAPILSSLSKLDLRECIERARYNADWIEAKIVTSLLSRKNADDFESKAAKVGFISARESEGRMVSTKFGEILRETGRPQRSYAVAFASRLLELGDFLR